MDVIPKYTERLLVPCPVEHACLIQDLAKEMGDSRLFDLALTATDYMSVVISARGKDGKPGAGPKVILKYIFRQSPDILHAH